MFKFYDIKLTKQEISIIYTISEQKNTQNRLMSLLAYYKKHSVAGVLKYSLNKLYKMYLRHHKAITKSYFYTLMNKIKEKFYSNVVLQEETKEEIKKVVPDIENTCLEDYESEPNIESNNNTIYINTNSSELMSTEDLIILAKDLFEEFKIKSNLVKNMVISKLQEVKNINVKGALAYVTKIIIDKKSIQEANRDFYYKNLNIQKNNKLAEKTASFNKNALKNNKKQLKFNNFTPREYDYESLEKKLLGWY